MTTRKSCPTCGSPIESPVCPHCTADDQRSSGEWRWYFGLGIEPEAYHGPESSREGAVAAGRVDFDGATFTIIEATKGGLWMPSGPDLIEKIIEDNEEAWGEEGFDDLVGTPPQVKAAEDELTELIRRWYARHAAIFPEPWRFGETRNRETVEGAADGTGGDPSPPVNADAVPGNSNPKDPRP